VAVVDATVDRAVGDDALDDELGAALRGQSHSPPSVGEGCVVSWRRLQLLDLVRQDSRWQWVHTRWVVPTRTRTR
jgi:hypothetical protein